MVEWVHALVVLPQRSYDCIQHTFTTLLAALDTLACLFDFGQAAHFPSQSVSVCVGGEGKTFTLRRNFQLKSGILTQTVCYRLPKVLICFLTSIVTKAVK